MDARVECCSMCGAPDGSESSDRCSGACRFQCSFVHQLDGAAGIRCQLTRGHEGSHTTQGQWIPYPQPDDNDNELYAEKMRQRRARKGDT